MSRPVAAVLLSLLAGLLGPSPSSATSLACGSTVTSAIRLEADLVDCPDAGLVIGAPNVTINLNGHTIDGDGRDDGIDSGIDNTDSHAGLRVVNGRITGFNYGVKVGAFPSLGPTVTTRAVVTGLSFVDVDSAVLLIRADENRIRHNEIDAVTGGIGVDLLGASRNVIRMNTIRREGVGIEVVNGHYNVMSRNLITASASGIQVGFDASYNLVRRNAIVENNATGLWIGRAIATRVARNRIRSNAGDGIDVLFSTGTALMGNAVAYNGSETPPGASGDGILVDSNSSETVLRRNRADGNRLDGIDVRSAATTLRANVARRNGQLGIRAVSGVRYVGNVAFGNGDPLQCVGITCRLRFRP